MKTNEEIAKQRRDEHFGYASDEERRSKRGLEDWEMVDMIPESQGTVPKWFFAIVVAVLIISLGLSYPFWGLRKGAAFNWEEWRWGVGAAVIWITLGAGFIWYMINLYGSETGGRLDDDQQEEDENP